MWVKHIFFFYKLKQWNKNFKIYFCPTLLLKKKKSAISVYLPSRLQRLPTINH